MKRKKGEKTKKSGLTVDSQVHGAPVLAGDEGVLAGIAPVGLRDGEAVQLPDGHVVEPLLHRKLDLHAVPQPAALHIILIHLKLKGRPMFLKNLQDGQFYFRMIFLWFVFRDDFSRESFTFIKK